MTINEAIGVVDFRKPNSYPDEVKASWIETLDGQFAAEVLGETSPDYGLSGWDTPLLIPKPHDDIYALYLAAQIDLTNGEYDHYTVSRSLYTTAMNEYRKWRHRTMPQTSADRFVNT